MSGPAGILELRRVGPVLVARLEGEVDLSDTGAFGEKIAEAMTGATALVIDLSAVTFFDSSGVRMLFDLLSDANRDDHPMAVVAPEDGPARMVMRICAFREELIGGSLEEALALVRR